MTTTSTHWAVAWTAALAAATTCGAVALASPAAAEVFDKHLAVDCPQPYSQACAPRQGLSVTTSDPFALVTTFTADGNPPACAPGHATIYIDGRPSSDQTLEPGSSLTDKRSNLPGTIKMEPGIHRVEVGVEGIVGGCNTGSMSGWSGSLHVETDADALRDLPAQVSPLCQRITC
jgi:hypothetical protein